MCSLEAYISYVVLQHTLTNTKETAVLECYPGFSGNQVHEKHQSKRVQAVPKLTEVPRPLNGLSLLLFQQHGNAILQSLVRKNTKSCLSSPPYSNLASQLHTGVRKLLLSFL